MLRKTWTCSAQNGLIWERRESFVVKGVVKILLLGSIQMAFPKIDRHNSSQNQNHENIASDTWDTGRARAAGMRAGRRLSSSIRLNSSRFVNTNPDRTLNQVIDFRNAMVKRAGVVASCFRRFIGIESTSWEVAGLQRTDGCSTIAISVSLVSSFQAEKSIFISSLY